MESPKAQSIIDLTKREEYEQALAVGIDASREEITAALLRLSHKFRAFPEVREALNKAAHSLINEKDAEKGQRLSKLDHEVESLPFLTKALLHRGDALNNHWLGSTLTHLGRCEEALPYLLKAVELRGNSDDHEWLAICRKRINAQQVQTQEEQKKRHLNELINQNQIYRVAVPKGSISVLRRCICCMEQTDVECEFTHTREEMQLLTRIRRTISFKLPVCSQCRAHQRELKFKRAGLVVTSLSLTLLVTYLFSMLVGPINVQSVLLIGAVCGLGIFFGLSKVFRLRCLDPKHASRGAAASLNGANDTHVIFQFWNPVWAHKFAEMNNSSVSVVSHKKYTWGISLLKGRSAIQAIGWMVSLTVIGGFAIFGILEAQWNQRVYAAPRTYRPATNYSVPQTNPRRYSFDGRSALLSEITSGRIAVQREEAEFNQMQEKLNSLALTISRYKASIEADETMSRLGARVDERAYEQNLATHNYWVKEHNALLLRMRSEYAVFENELNALNDKIRRYNSHIR